MGNCKGLSTLQKILLIVTAFMGSFQMERKRRWHNSPRPSLLIPFQKLIPRLSDSADDNSEVK